MPPSSSSSAAAPPLLFSATASSSSSHIEAAVITKRLSPGTLTFSLVTDNGLTDKLAQVVLADLVAKRCHRDRTLRPTVVTFVHPANTLSLSHHCKNEAPVTVVDVTSLSSLVELETRLQHQYENKDDTLPSRVCSFDLLVIESYQDLVQLADGNDQASLAFLERLVQQPTFQGHFLLYVNTALHAPSVLITLQRLCTLHIQIETRSSLAAYPLLLQHRFPTFDACPDAHGWALLKRHRVREATLTQSLDYFVQTTSVRDHTRTVKEKEEGDDADLSPLLRWCSVEALGTTQGTKRTSLVSHTSFKLTLSDKEVSDKAAVQLPYARRSKEEASSCHHPMEFTIDPDDPDWDDDDDIDDGIDDDLDL